MARLILPKPLTFQPHNPVIDRSHPLGRRITACIDANAGAEIQPVEMVSGLPGAWTTATHTIRKNLGVAGVGISPTHGFNDGVSWPATHAFGDATAGVNFSVEMLLSLNSSLTNNFARTLDFGAAKAGGATGGWDLEDDTSGTDLILAVWNGSSAATFNVTGTMALGRSYHLVQTYEWVSGTTWNLKAYVNGVIVVNTTCVMSQATSSIFLYANYQTGGGLASPNKTLNYARIYQGTLLGPSDVHSLYVNPWQVYKAPDRVIASASLAPAPVTGTIAITEDPDVLAATGTLIFAGTFAATEDADTMSAAGESEDEGVFAATEDPDTMIAYGVQADFNTTIIPVALFPPKFDSTIRRPTDVTKLVDPQLRPTQAYRRWMEAVDIAIRRQATTSQYVILPTSDPHVVGALWNNAGTVTVSAG